MVGSKPNSSHGGWRGGLQERSCHLVGWRTSLNCPIPASLLLRTNVYNSQYISKVIKPFSHIYTGDHTGRRVVTRAQKGYIVKIEIVVFSSHIFVSYIFNLNLARRPQWPSVKVHEKACLFLSAVLFKYVFTGA